MTQAQMNEELSAKTGESLGTIRRRGFSLVTHLSILDPDDDASPQIVDWDRLAEERPRAA